MGEYFRSSSQVAIGAAEHHIAEFSIPSAEKRHSRYQTGRIDGTQSKLHRIGASAISTSELTLQQEIYQEMSRSKGSALALKTVVAHQSLDLDKKSSIIYNPKQNQFTYICEAPPIKNLVINGGGAKGVFVPGALQAFEEHASGEASFRDQLEHVAGTSVGAINAALIAVGMSADSMIQATAAVDFTALLGQGIWGKDGQPLEDFIRKQLQNSLTKHILRILSSADLNSITPQQIELLKITKGSDLAPILDELKKSKPFITFEMLSTLRKLDPITFKNLTVTAVCRETGQACYFDAQKTPHLDIATACRASASLPIILKPVSIENKWLSPGYADEGAAGSYTFVDGGYLDNIPIEVMETEQTDQNLRGDYGQNLQTLVLIFDNVKKSPESQSPFLNHHTKKHALYNSSNLLTRLITDLFVKWFAQINTPERYTLNKEARLNEVSTKYVQRHIPLFMDGLETLDFKKAKQGEQRYREQGRLQTRAYLDLHQGELMAKTFDSFDELYDALPLTTRRQMSAELAEFRKLTVRDS